MWVDDQGEFSATVLALLEPLGLRHGYSMFIQTLHLVSLFPDAGDQGVRCDSVCGRGTGCRKGNRMSDTGPF